MDRAKSKVLHDLLAGGAQGVRHPQVLPCDSESLRETPDLLEGRSTREVALEFGEGGELEPLGGMVVELSSKDTEHPLDKIDLVKIRDSVIRGHDRHGRIPSEVVDRTRDPIRAVEHNVLVKGEHEFATGFAEPVVQGLREPQVRFVADQPARW